MKKDIKKDPNISPFVQKVTVIALSVLYFLQAVGMAALAGQVYGDGLRMSPFLLVVIQAVLFPLLLFIIAYVINPEKLKKFPRLFISVLYAVFGVGLAAFIGILRSYHGYAVEVGTMNELLIESAPALIALVAYIPFVLYMNRSTLQTSAHPSRLFRMLFISLGFLSFAAITFLLSFLAINQYSSNSNLSSFVAPTISSVLLPGIIFGLTYLLNRERDSLDRMFYSVLMAIIGCSIFAILSGNGNFVFIQLTLNENTYLNSILWQIIIAVVSIISMVYLTLMSRRIK